MSNLVFSLLILAAPATKDTTWLGLYLMGNKIGYISVIQQELNDGYKIDETTFMKVQMLGTSKTVILRTSYETDKNYKIKKLTFDMVTQDQRVNGSAHVKGDTLTVNYTSASGAPIERKMIASSSVFTETTLRLYLEKKRPRRFTCSLFDVTTATLQEAICELVEEKAGTANYRLDSQGTSSKLTLKNGKFYREEGPMGIVIQKESKGEALKIGSEIDITELYSVKPSQPIRATKYLRLKLVGNLTGLNLNLGPQKVVSSTQNSVTVEIAQDQARCGDNEIPDSVKHYLISDAYVQSEAREVQLLAKEITGKIKDPCKKVAAIINWLNQNITKAPSVTIPTAIDVLRERRGDCNEHAVLFTALARAAGIPSDIVAGLIYQDGAYYYHAWSMVFVGGKWVFVDPIFGEFPASLKHIALTRGSLENQSEIMRVAGEIKIIVEAQQ
ncbi:MAG: transglutaminase-like domain-containing protein [candidate division WOR-3 bacterium]